MKRLRFCHWLVLGLLFAIGSSQLRAAETSQEGPLVVFFVRHAEKTDAGNDPELSDTGKDRAEVLARALRDANVQYIHSSNFIRTRDTAAPIAARLKLNVALYNPRDLTTLVKKVQETGGRHLIVGHSNTTPDAVRLLGGTPGSAINEAGEFDRLYIVTVEKQGAASTVLMRYGKPFK